jgi:hypothetical protein
MSVIKLNNIHFTLKYDKYLNDTSIYILLELQVCVRKFLKSAEIFLAWLLYLYGVSKMFLWSRRNAVFREPLY